jgi:hypothetical protein
LFIRELGQRAAALMHGEAGQEKRRKTVLRTVRITSDLDHTLEKDARAKKATVNALIGSIFTKYAEWDRFTEKLGFVSISGLFLRELLARLTVEEIGELGREMGKRLPGEMARFWFKQVNVDALIGLISLYCTYAGAGEYELETNGRDYSVVVHHNLGEKWSIYLENLISTASEEALRIRPKFIASEDFVSMTIRLT